jgi:hypothetical protein
VAEVAQEFNNKVQNANAKKQDSMRLIIETFSDERTGSADIY